MSRALHVSLCPARILTPHWFVRDTQHAEARVHRRWFAVRVDTEGRSYVIEGFIGMGGSGIEATGHVVTSLPAWWGEGTPVPLRASDRNGAVATVDVRAALGGIVPRVR